MAEELRLALILLGSLAIGAVVLHGIWTVRKNVNEERKLHAKDSEPEEVDLNEEELEIQSLKIKQMEMDFSTLGADSQHGLPVVDVDVDSIYHHDKAAKDESGVKVQGQVSEISIESEIEHEVAPQLTKDANQGSLLDDDEMPSFSALDDEASTKQNDITLQFDQRDTSGFDETTAAQEKPPIQDHYVDSGSEVSKETTAEPAKKNEVLILYIDKPEGDMIDGAKLLPLLLTLGFKFGEMDFFHRHEQSSGHGEILFSLANMYNPGTFDIDNMEQVSTRGLSIFMTLPNAGEALQTFNMMHNAAKKIADEFDAYVLDANRQRLDVLRVRHYIEKIRKF
ncbi:cell division protein ZipA [Psychrosphaera aestuarii]|uniref:cell division protein ZipA n=1 Tax=Psychrosphaera aestuarii TaxID=1266052 RepID=UPI001B332E7F|nr:cell division protein ZipA [Psychrosphaera aestuarii]